MVRLPRVSINLPCVHCRCKSCSGRTGNLAGSRIFKCQCAFQCDISLIDGYGFSKEFTLFSGKTEDGCGAPSIKAFWHRRRYCQYGCFFIILRFELDYRADVQCGWRHVHPKTVIKKTGARIGKLNPIIIGSAAMA